MGLVSTFKDSQIFGGIYFYSYALIIIAILFGALYFTTKVRLFHESNKFLQDVAMYLSKCTLSIRELTKECDKLNETIKLKNVFDAEMRMETMKNFQKSQQVCKGYIHQMFNNIHTILDKHENYLLNRIDNTKVDYLSKDTSILNQLERSTDLDVSKTRKGKNCKLPKDMENLANEILSSCKDIGNNGNETTNIKRVARPTSSRCLINTPRSKRDEMTGDRDVKHADDNMQANAIETCVTEKTDKNGNASITDLTRHHEIVIDVENKEEEKCQLQIQTANTNRYSDSEEMDAVGYAVEIQKLKERIDRKYKKYQQVSSKDGLKSFFKRFYKIRGLLLPSLTHFFDTATDIALVWEFYILKDMNEFDNQDIDIDAFFVLSLGVLIYYRISSAFEVWQFTGNKNETILQFLFDFFLIKLTYINIFKMKSYQASHVIKQFRMIEGGNESAFQAILTFVFLLKTGNFDNNVAVVSLGASLFSLMSRLSILDKNCLIDEAKELKNFEISDIFTKPKQAFDKIHKEFVFHRLFRCIEILYSIFLISIFWHFVGGVWLIFLMIVGIVNVYQQYNRSGQIRTDWFNYILVINIAEVGDYFQGQQGHRDCHIIDTLIPLRIFYVRSILTIIIVIVLVNNDAFLSVILIFPFLATIVTCYIIVKYWTVLHLSQNSVVENFRIFDYIANDNEECVWFCKYLKCDIFYQITKMSINYNGCKIEVTKPYCGAFYEPSNVIEAILRSNNVNYFEIISQWYDEVKLNNNDININNNLYSYSRKHIKMDNEMMGFLLFSCKNVQVFEHFVCNDAYFIDLDDDRSSKWIYKMVSKSIEFFSRQALNHLLIRFSAYINTFHSYRIWCKVIYPDLFSLS